MATTRSLRHIKGFVVQNPAATADTAAMLEDVAGFFFSHRDATLLSVTYQNSDDGGYHESLVVSYEDA